MDGPRLGLSQHAGVRQEMQIQPRMLQSVEVLQLPATELESYLLRAVEENEALTLVESPREAAPPAGPRGSAADSDRHAAWLESHAAPDQGLADSLLEQLALVDLDADLRPYVELVIEHLDPGGILVPSDEELLAAAAERGLEPSLALLGCAIATVQRLEPPGVGGRNAVEALLLQLDPHDADYGELCLLLEDFLDDVARNKLPAVARAMGVDLDRLAELIARLRELRLSPGAELAPAASPAIKPEVLVTASGAGFEVRVDQSGLPAVEIDDGVRAVARDRAHPESVRHYLRDKLDRARWLVEAVEQRRRTLLRIAQAVFSHQRGFLDEGPGHLRPLRMNELADRLGIHVSTVSRAAAGKYVETPHGVFPLRHFFQAAGGSEDATARSDVRAVVGEVVAAEDASNPLSDGDIVKALAARGLKVARRTVAKYRGELGIPSSYRRRTY
jgi:RNA polymerase sigma-54 factor